MEAVEPKDFNQLPSIKLPDVNFKRESGCVFYVLDGRYFFNEVYSDNFDSQLIVFDLHHNRVSREYFYLSAEHTTFRYGNFVPYDLYSGIIYYRESFQLLHLDKKGSTVKYVGSMFSIQDCLKICCVQFLRLNGDPGSLALICYKTNGTSHVMRLYKLLKFENPVACMVCHDTNNNNEYQNVFPKQVDNHLYLMRTKTSSGLDHIELLRYDLQRNENSVALEKIQTTCAEEWLNRRNPYVTGAWRDQNFICCINSKIQDNSKQTDVYCFELSTLKWSRIFLPHRGMFSMLVDVRYGSADTLMFCSFIFEPDDPIHFTNFDSIHRFAASKPETLYLICLFEAIRHGLLKQRLETLEKLNQLDTKFRLLSQKQNKMKKLQEELDGIESDVSDLRRQAIASNKIDPTSKWAHLIDFKLPLTLLFK